MMTNEEKIEKLATAIQGLQNDIMIIATLGKFDQQARDVFEGQRGMPGWNPAFKERCRSFYTKYYKVTEPTNPLKEE